MSPVDIEAIREHVCPASGERRAKGWRQTVLLCDEIASVRAERDEARAALAAMTEERDRLERALDAARGLIDRADAERDAALDALAALGVTHGD